MTDKVAARNDSRARWLDFAEPVRIIAEQTRGPLADPTRELLRRCGGHGMYAREGCEVTDVSR